MSARAGLFESFRRRAQRCPERPIGREVVAFKARRTRWCRARPPPAEARAKGPVRVSAGRGDDPSPVRGPSPRRFWSADAADTPRDVVSKSRSLPAERPTGTL